VLTRIVITWPAWCALTMLGQLCSTEGGTACSVPRRARQAVHDCLCQLVQEYRDHMFAANVDTSAKQRLLLLSTDQRRLCFERVATRTERRIQCCFEIPRICRGRAQPIYDLNATSSCVQLVRSEWSMVKLVYESTKSLRCACRFCHLARMASLQCSSSCLRLCIPSALLRP